MKPGSLEQGADLKVLGLLCYSPVYKRTHSSEVSAPNSIRQGRPREVWFLCLRWHLCVSASEALLLLFFHA